MQKAETNPLFQKAPELRELVFSTESLDEIVLFNWLGQILFLDISQVEATDTDFLSGDQSDPTLNRFRKIITLNSVEVILHTMQCLKCIIIHRLERQVLLEEGHPENVSQALQDFLLE